MKKILEFFLAFFLRIALWFRYRIEIRGLEKLNKETLKKPGGILFLPNHPTVFVDATAITIALWPKYPLRPLIVEYMYELPIVNRVMKLLDALPVPSFTESSNSIKRKKNEKVLKEVMEGLRQGQNFLIFPAGHLKSTSQEIIGGASATQRIVQETPEANVVLVRVKGLWGSSFSRALTGKSPPLFPVVFHGIKKVLKNLLFFTPRRKVIIEFEPAPPNFPYQANRIEFNRYLEEWYNQPDLLTPQKQPSPGDSLILISYSMWSNDIPQLWHPETMDDVNIQLSQIPVEVQKSVIAKISELMGIDPSSITPNMILTTDLGMDSLDIAEMAAFLQDQHDVTNIAPTDLTTVAKIMALAAKEVQGESVQEEDFVNMSKWKKPIEKKRAHLAKGETLPEVFLNCCKAMGNQVACADMRTGVVTYPQLKVRILILADYIRQVPGKYVGILLPASVTASMCIIACQLAGKIPVMVNWTVGTRHLQAVSELSKVQCVLSSWAFIDRLQNVDFDGIEDKLVMLEDVRRKIGIGNKLKAYFRSKFGVKRILKMFNYSFTKNSEAVLLFTSGTESMPKGVPLSHQNILSNQKAGLEAIEVFTNDVIFGILPPFHSFGFTVSSLIGLLSGVRIAFSPDPTDGKRLADAFEKWGITIVLGAPTFIKGMIKAASKEQLQTLRLCITGAEKMPPDLVLAIEQLGKSECLYEGYGITECSPILTFTPIGKPRKGVGQPLSNVELLIVDLNSHQPLPLGTQGLILAKGPNVFKEYLNPGLNPPFMTVDGEQWYITGDLGHLDEEGNLILSGRLKRFVKVGGEMVSLTSLEEALGKAVLSNHWVQAEEGPILAICGKEIPGEKPKITLYTKFPIAVDAANKLLRDAGFSNVVKISSAHQLSEIPVMGSGKVNYRKLEEDENKHSSTALVALNEN